MTAARYVELQCTSHFSFLRVASSCEELFEQAAALGIEALAIVDRNSLAGVVRAHVYARQNRAAIGARVKVVVDDLEGEREIHRTVCTGGSFGSSTLRQEIGVGKARVVKRVEVYWPVSRSTQVLTDLDVNHAYRIREDATTPVRMELKSFAWPAGSGA